MRPNKPERQGVAPVEVYDHLTQAIEIFTWLDAIAAAISESSDNKYRVKSLSGLMRHLATDWSAHFHNAADEIAKQNGITVGSDE